MCILITEDAKKKIYMDRAKAAGLLDEQITPTADLLWAMKQAKSVGYAKSILVKDNMLSDLMCFTFFFRNE